MALSSRYSGSFSSRSPCASGEAEFRLHPAWSHTLVIFGYCFGWQSFRGEIAEQLVHVLPMLLVVIANLPTVSRQLLPIQAELVDGIRGRRIEPKAFLI